MPAPQLKSPRELQDYYEEYLSDPDGFTDYEFMESQAGFFLSTLRAIAAGTATISAQDLAKRAVELTHDQWAHQDTYGEHDPSVPVRCFTISDYFLDMPIPEEDRGRPVPYGEILSTVQQYPVEVQCASDQGVIRVGRDDSLLTVCVRIRTTRKEYTLTFDSSITLSEFETAINAVLLKDAQGRPE